MAKALLLAFTGPKSPELEDEYNEWYDSVHLPDVLAVPGVRSARRFKLADGPRSDPAPGEYVAVYELDADDLAQVERDMRAAHDRGDMPVSRALRLGPTLYYEALPDRTDLGAGRSDSL